jgi:hypothetical protein
MVVEVSLEKEVAISNSYIIRYYASPYLIDGIRRRTHLNKPSSTRKLIISDPSSQPLV